MEYLAWGCFKYGNTVCRERKTNDVNGTIISENIRENIKDDFAKFFTKYDSDLCGYWASLVDSVMFEWVKTNR